VSPSQIIHALQGAPSYETCIDLDAFVCWVCGGSSTRGMSRERWQGSNFTSQNRVRCPDSLFVCEACVVVMSGRPPDTERMWSHLVEGDSHVRVNKGQKPAIREFLRRPHGARWFAAIADSGKRHIIPWCSINTAGQRGGRVLFEEALVELPRDDAGWALIDVLTKLLTGGATKEEISRGEYGPRAWQLLGERVRAFEDAYGHLRGGSWFELALWLSQRDEEQVQARMSAEKEARRNGRANKGAAPNPDRRGAPRAQKRVPANAGGEPPQELAGAPGPTAGLCAYSDKRGGMADIDDARSPAPGSVGDQLEMFSRTR
jgi:hypothetical protein